MAFRPLVLCLALAIAGWPAGVARAEADVLKSKPEAGAIDKPRLVVAISGQAAFLDQLKAKLERTQRFQVLVKPAMKDTLKKAKITLDGKLSVEQSRQAMKVADTELVLDGKVEQASGGVKVTGRLFDFRTGEITRDLSLLGDSSDLELLAGQLTAFVRHSVPLRTAIKAITPDDEIVLDLGAVDGVVPGSFFTVLRYPRNLDPRVVGTIKVIKVDPFASTAEAEETAGGVTLAPGDVLVEQTSSYLLSK